MEWASKETVGVLQYLLPGLFTAWIFYGLTAHRRPTPFERVVQALIFTAIVQVFVSLLRWLLLTLGHFFAIGSWSDEVGFVLAMLVAAVLGHVLAYCANNDLYHRFLRDDLKEYPQLAWARKLALLRMLNGVTSRRSFPEQWINTPELEQRWVLLHLEDGRRLFGWPYLWPERDDSDHFIIMKPEWVLEDNERAPLDNVEGMRIRASDVRYVDVLRFNDEVEVNVSSKD